MHTTEKLALALEDANLPQMAKKAREGYYHDYLSPIAMPEMALDEELHAAAKAGNLKAAALRKRHHQGEFDATKEESDAWAKTPEGQSAMAEIAARPPTPEQLAEKEIADAIEAITSVLKTLKSPGSIYSVLESINASVLVGLANCDMNVANKTLHVMFERVAKKMVQIAEPAEDALKPSRIILN